MSPTVAGSLGNSAEVKSSLPDGASSADNKTSQSIAVAALGKKDKTYADLSLALSGPASTKVGKTATYKTMVKNKGPLGASDVIVNLPLPAGATFQSSASDTRCKMENGAIVCQIGAIAKKKVQKLTIALNFAAANRYILTGQAFAAEGDKSIKNNIAKFKTRVR